MPSNSFMTYSKNSLAGLFHAMSCALPLAVFSVESRCVLTPATLLGARERSVSRVLCEPP